MLSQRGLAAFLSVMRAGSLTGAAAELSVSQPAISRHIRELEAATGLALFDRVGNRVSPTEAAHALADEVERTFVGLAEIEAAAREIRAGRRDRLRIGAMPALSVSVLADVMADLRAEDALPDTEIVTASTQTVARLVARRQAALGFIAPILDSPEIRLLMHARVPLACVMNADHPLAGRERVRLEDLAGLPVIALSVSTATGMTLEQTFARMPRPPRITTRARLAPVVSALALRGLGLGIVDAFSAAEHVARGGVSRPLEIAETFGFSVVTTRVGRLHPAAEPVMEHLRRRLAGVGGSWTGALA
jgi:DNA-binding transcriptional LysR family regulator